MENYRSTIGALSKLLPATDDCRRFGDTQSPVTVLESLAQVANRIASIDYGHDQAKVEAVWLGALYVTLLGELGRPVAVGET